MLALVRIQLCSLLILDCKAGLLPGNYTARAGRQTYFQHTSLKRERVFSDFFFPSLSSKSEPARKLWREALVLICASHMVAGLFLQDLDTQQTSLGLSSRWGSLLVEGEPTAQHLGWRRNVVLPGCVFEGLLLQKWGSLLITFWSNRIILTVGANVRCSRCHTLRGTSHTVPHCWRTESRARCAWLNQDHCSVVLCLL